MKFFKKFFKKLRMSSGSKYMDDSSVEEDYEARPEIGDISYMGTPSPNHKCGCPAALLFEPHDLFR